MGVAKKSENGNNEKVASKVKYVNKQRVLVFCSRGISTRYRHFMDDLRRLLPHHKKDVKLDAKDNFTVVNEIAEIKGCNNTIFLEARKRNDLYMWVSKTPVGPSCKFYVQNVHTMDELKMTGNSLMGSRPLLTFDEQFNQLPHLLLIKQMFIQIWGTPLGHPKSKPFIDRVMSFYYADGKIWCRNYQLSDEADTKKMEAAASHKGDELVNLIEIGPRFVLTPIRIFNGSFQGQTLYENPHYISPNQSRQSMKSDKHDKYVTRKKAQKSKAVRNLNNVMPVDQVNEIYN